MRSEVAARAFPIKAGTATSEPAPARMARRDRRIDGIVSSFDLFL
jgi:hypothetical protein